MSQPKPSDTVPFRRIGAGFCGSVWATPDDVHAFKREDGGPGRSLSNDFQMHKRILESLDQLVGVKKTASAPSFRIQVPRCYRLIKAEDQEWWDQNLRHFPDSYSPCKVLHSERIPPMPRGIREFLIDQYCPVILIPDIKTSDANTDCLIRPYLGRRRLNNSKRTRPSRFSAFSLRNFPLHVDQMEQLGVATEAYAEIMAETLAMMHWHGKIDANDVEFALAPPRLGAAPSNLPSGILGDHEMWLLDFDCCRSMSMDQNGVNQAVAAFFRNDPFYPRPGAQQHLWEAFREQYLQVSSKIIRSTQNSDAVDARTPLPGLFIGQIETEQLKRNERVTTPESRSA
jgi:hypothetical protein